MKLSWLPLPAPTRRARRAKGRVVFRSLSLSPAAFLEAMVFIPVPRPLRELLSSLGRAPQAGADGDARLSWIDEVAARLIGAVAAFCDEPQAVASAQRSLLLLGGRRGSTKADLDDLSRALRRIDEQVGAAQGGFSRLLDAALTSGSVVVEERLSASSIEGELHPLALALEQIARELLALDDLAHALSVPAELPAGAVVLEGTLDLAEGAGVVCDEEVVGVARQVIARRGLDERLGVLLGLRHALEHIDDSVVEEAVARGVATPLSLWVLAHRLAGHERLEAAPDRAALDRLLCSAGLMPLEVFDAATLWRDLDDDER